MIQKHLVIMKLGLLQEKILKLCDEEKSAVCTRNDVNTIRKKIVR